MAYIGNKPTVGNFQICDAISVVNGQAAYTMQVGSVNVIPQSANHMICSLNGTIQKPNSSYTVSGSTITFSSNLATGDVIDFIQILGDVLDLGVPSDATVTTAKLTSTSVTAAKLNNDIISGTTALTSEPADTDEFLVSDAGTLKRIDYSLIKGGGITVADQWRVNTNLSASSVNSFTHISANWEQIDSTGQGTIGTAMSNSSGTFTFPSTGIYLVKFQINYYDSDSNTALGAAIDFSVNNGSSYGNLAQNFTNTHNGSNVNATAITSSLVDVQNASTYKIRFYYYVSGSSIVYGAGQNSTFATFIRLGDT